MKIPIIALSLASFFSTAGEYQTSVGLGHEYGGVLGAQFAYKTESTKYYGSAGLVGIAVGFQTTLDENSKHAYGLVAGREELRSDYGFIFVTYDYHLEGFSHNGFVVGTGIGVTRRDEGGIFSDTGITKTEMSVTLNVGYKF